MPYGINGLKFNIFDQLDTAKYPVGKKCVVYKRGFFEGISKSGNKDEKSSLCFVGNHCYKQCVTYDNDEEKKLTPIFSIVSGQINQNFHDPSHIRHLEIQHYSEINDLFDEKTEGFEPDKIKSIEEIMMLMSKEEASIDFNKIWASKPKPRIEIAVDVNTFALLFMGNRYHLILYKDNAGDSKILFGLFEEEKRDYIVDGSNLPSLKGYLKRVVTNNANFLIVNQHL